MKKKIMSLLLLWVYLFGGAGMVFADPMEETLKANEAGSVERDAAVDARRDESIKEMEKGGASSSPSWGPDDMTSTNFMMDASSLSPSQKSYKKGTEGNFKELLANIGKYLLIATTTIAVLSIAVGGLMISTTGASDRAAKWKTIITLNIMAIIIALFSYSIIRLVSWLIA